jgi:hypothetical protein
VKKKLALFLPKVGTLTKKTSKIFSHPDISINTPIDSPCRAILKTFDMVRNWSKDREDEKSYKFDVKVKD